MTPDLEYSHKIHDQTMKKWWKLQEYIKERQAFIKRNPVCIRCGRPISTPGHSYEDYSSFEQYLAAVVTNKCDPLCSACNMQERKGKKPCPECIKRGNDQIRYIGQDQETCYDCRPQTEKDISAQHKRDSKKLIRELRDKDNTFRRRVYQERKRGIVNL